MNESDIIGLIKSDRWMMGVLSTAKKLNLPDWWIGAGFVRNKVWDRLHNFKERTPLSDVDVIYFDPKDFEEKEIKGESTKMEKKYEVELEKMMPNIKWSVTNQARMHVFHAYDKAYKNSTDALSRWVETATCIGVRLDKNNKLEITTPHGIEDLVGLKLKPVNTTNSGLQLFYRRIKEKNWLKRWPKLMIVES